MRFPKFNDLDPEQKAIYIGAPSNESILVMGPPGTGKTVLAFFRAAELLNRHKKEKTESTKPMVIMYNKALKRYAEKRDGGVADGVDCATMHQWVWRWYLRANGGSRPPMLGGNSKYEHDWEAMLSPLLRQAVSAPTSVNWGHLIIDEGQDFPPAMYRTLSMLSGAIQSPGGSPAVTVFADENQRLSERCNSTLEEIQGALALRQDRVYLLRKNYRNSKQIAKFARHYYVGLRSGMPDIPDRSGPSKPKIVIASSLEVVRRRIADFVSARRQLDIGVLCPREAERRRIFNSLQHRLSESGVHVQTYSSACKDAHPAEALVFDKGGSVTVINCQSAKGLEFDAVFLIDPFAAGAGAADVQSRMQLYVMASRARDHLELLLMNPPGDLASFLPPEDLYEQSHE
jgi:DNA helicase II / ATP-dependent DNA helicase PcrA